MPTGAIAMAPDSLSLPASLKQPTPLSSLSRQGSGINLFGGAASHLAMPTPLSGGFQPYVVEDEGGMLTPDPVKVTKVKKKVRHQHPRMYDHFLMHITCRPRQNQSERPKVISSERSFPAWTFGYIFGDLHHFLI